MPEADEVSSGAFEAKGGGQQAQPRPMQDGKKGKKSAQKLLPAYGIELCCSPESDLGKVSESIGVKHIGLTKSNGNIAELEVQSQFLEALDSDEMNGVDLWGSIPCNPGSSWQRLNWKRLGPEFRRRLMAQRLESRNSFGSFSSLPRSF